MRLKTVALLVVAVGCGLFAMLGVRQAMNGRNQGEQEEKVSVLVALTEIPVGTPLTPENVTFQERAVSSLANQKDAVLTEEGYADRAANVPMLPGDVIILSKLTEPGVRGKSVQIEKGMRVVSVKVNDTQTHSNMLAPGDRVDVLVTYASRNQRGMTTKTKTLLEYVEIFATGNKTVTDGNIDDKGQVKNVSLLVTPEQANFVYLAERKGELSLVWRNIADDEQVQVGAVDERLMEELSGTVDKDAGYGGYPSPYMTRSEGVVEPPPTVGSWLEEQEAVVPEPEPEPTPVQVAVAEPEEDPVPTWKLVIFSGERAETVEFELPEEETPSPDLGKTSVDGKTTANELETATEQVSAPSKASNPFGSILDQFQNLPFGK